MEIGRLAYRQSDIKRAMLRSGMRGPMLFVYGLLALYALEIALPLVVLTIALVARRARRAQSVI